MAQKNKVKTLPTISIVVLNWNGKRFIDGFLKTFSEQTYPKELLELLFVDNDSSDDSVAYFRQSIKDNGLNAKVVLNDKNYGYAEGNNRGIYATSGDYVLVCNNDLELDKDLFTKLVETAQNKNSAATVPKLMYLNKKGIINNAGSKLVPKSDWPIIETGANEKDKGQFDSVREISAFCGACVLFSRQFLQEVGVFDPKFFMYFEDGDLSWRGQKAGFKFYYAPEAVAHHIHTGSSTEGSPLFNHFVGRNRLLLITKHSGLRQWTSAWVKTIRDHLVLRIKRILLAIINRYPKRLALREFMLSQKMIWASIALTPYALAKRLKIVNESKL